MQEQEIIGRIREQDPGGAELLLTHYGPLMRYIIAPILSDPQDREECLSEAALRIWQKIGLYDPELGSWKAWVTSVTRRTALNKLRAVTRQEETEELTADIPSPEPTPEELVLRKEQQQELKRALNLFSQKDQAIFYRKYYYLQPTVQIASELGLTERAVEGRLYRMKKQLRKVLGGDRNG